MSKIPVKIRARGLLLFFSLIIVRGVFSQEGHVFLTNNGLVHFVSDAPLEMIEAHSTQLNGTIDPQQKIFSFRLDISSFAGFNSSLQQDHFIENYMESERFPDARFTGKIIEDVDFSADGLYQVRAKGKLELHGVARERIIKSTVRVVGDQLHLLAQFSVLLSEHDIVVPKIVNQKIAGEIVIDIEAQLTKQKM